MPVEIKSLDGRILGIVDCNTLQGVNLRNANLRNANLRNANLQDANLQGANLQGANLWDADLQDTDLRNANLRYANLQYANLQGANLQGANLQYANLRSAYLQYANLRNADLRNANLRNARLQDANLQGANLPDFQIPQNVEIIGYKKISTGVITLKIPAESRRTACLISKKCRAEFAIMISGENGVSLTSWYPKLNYTLGEKIIALSYNDDIRHDCADGIHFFTNRKDAEEFVL